MSKGLLLRGKVWHVHLHVPGNLAALFVRQQIRFSTGLTDKRQALQVAQRVRDELLTLSYERRLADLVSKKNKKGQIVRKEMIERVVLEFGSNGKPTKQTTDRIDTGDDDEDRRIYESLFTDNPLVAKTKCSQKSLSELVGQYNAERAIDKSITDKTKREIERTLALLLELVTFETGSDKTPFAGIDRVLATKVKVTLAKLPPRRSQLPMYRDLPLRDVIALRESSGGSVLSSGSMQKTLTIISSFGGWCQQFGFWGTNHFAGLVDGNRRGSTDREERDQYTSEELAAIFESGGVGEAKYHYDYWLPVLALYTGARLGELCQLRPCDVVAEDVDGRTIWSMNITDDGRLMALKNSNSKRQIALHPNVIKLGFLDFVAGQLGRLSTVDAPIGGSLFGICWEQSNGFIRNPGRRFKSLLKRVGAYEEGRAYHGFRHNLTDALKQAEVSPELIAEITGHSTRSIDLDRYSKRFGLGLQLAALSKVDYRVAIVPAPNSLSVPRNSTNS